ncbi:DUF4365 domain-containing protein [Catellatospora sichuanensis]|uniref:DUF4365 domain-containing protein n=1 Tax=Catellatospora sichuanensis TaxID=1969805 RepID=UPI001182EC12|nr:DUF4365 domain-containing protein [Catellatospora sichuanensis]
MMSAATGRIRSTADHERQGVALSTLAFADLGWHVREQMGVDYGIDAQAEFFYSNRTPSGRLIALQIKCGPSFFKQRRDGGWVFKGENKHLRYWLAHSLHVLVLLANPETKDVFWVHVTSDQITFTKKAWTIVVPEGNRLDLNAADALKAIAFGQPAATADVLSTAMSLLPGSAVEMLDAARGRDIDGAMRVARELADGRFEPRAAAERLLAQTGQWSPRGRGLLEAAVGAYANEHGHSDVGATAFAAAAASIPADAARLLGIASLLSLAAGDRGRAEEFLRRSTENGVTTIFAQVADCVLNEPDDARQARRMDEIIDRVQPEMLDSEPGILLFMGDRALRRSEFDTALRHFRRAAASLPRMTGGRLGIARTLMEKMITGRSVLPGADLRQAEELGLAVREEILRWAGPTHGVHLLLVQARLMSQAFREVIDLATPSRLGGQATERESTTPEVAVCGATAAVALRDRGLALTFADAVSGKAAEHIVRAIAIEGMAHPALIAAMLREGLKSAASPMLVRTCLSRLAGLGQLHESDLDAHGIRGNVSHTDRQLFLARSAALAGDSEAAVAMLRSHSASPAAGELLIEVLQKAGRYEEALLVCDQTRDHFGSAKAAYDKINILANLNRRDEADQLAKDLLAGTELPSEHRRSLRYAVVESRAIVEDWPGAEREARAAAADVGPDAGISWWLIFAQLRQDRVAAAWDTYCELRPDVFSPETVLPWLELHRRNGCTSQARAEAQTFLERWPDPALAEAVRQGLEES